MIALMGDAELDEGNIYEALIEGAKVVVNDLGDVPFPHRTLTSASIH